MILLQLHKIPYNSQNIVQLLKIYHTTFKYGATFENISCKSGRMYIFGNMYNDLRKVLGYLPGHILIVGKEQYGIKKQCVFFIFFIPV